MITQSTWHFIILSFCKVPSKFVTFYNPSEIIERHNNLKWQIKKIAKVLRKVSHHFCLK